MLNDQMVRGTHFTCFHAGPMKGWTDFKLEPPDVPRSTRGKLFLRNLLGSAGQEMSLNVVLPGSSYVQSANRAGARSVPCGRRVHRRGGRFGPAPGSASGTGLAEQLRCAAVLPLHPVPGR